MTVDRSRKYYLLLGAGFSRNWGGWLASELFEFLISDPRIRSNGEVLERLWIEQTEQGGGGFEGALDYFQRQYAASRNSEDLSRLLLLQDASVDALRTMDKHLLPDGEMPSFNISKFRQGGVVDFLSKFHAIFTLNQDTLLERRYVATESAALESRSNWAGTILPGISVPRDWGLPFETPGFVTVKDVPMPKVQDRFQPLLKLHGSWNWKNSDSTGMIILGGAKASAIERAPLLKSYSDYFASQLQNTRSRLMVIGYGFRDQHINSVIEHAVRAGLELFVVDPLGHSAVLGGKVGPKGQRTVLESALIGASRRSLTSIFGGDLVESQKIDQFFGPS